MSVQEIVFENLAWQLPNLASQTGSMLHYEHCPMVSALKLNTLRAPIGSIHHA